MPSMRRAQEKGFVEPNESPVPETGQAGPDARWGNAQLLALLSGGGGTDASEPLDPRVRARAEASLGVDLGQVTVHTGPKAATRSAAGGGHALAVGPEVFLGPGLGNDDNPVLLHELVHVAQQQEGAASTPHAGRRGEDEADAGARAIEAGTRFEVSASAAGRPQSYQTFEHVQLGDKAAGAEVFTVQGVQVSSGELNALGDFYGSPEAVLGADPAELSRLVQLIRQEVTKPGSVSTAQWQAASNNRYLDLAGANDEHFAPHDGGLVADSGGGEDHASTWDAMHRKALTLAAEAAAMPPSDPARAEKLSRAKVTNAFADHFISDAFSAGHLFNKNDLMAQAKARLEALTPEARDALFETVAAPVFDQNEALLEQYEGHDAWFGWVSLGFTTDPFTRFLKKVYVTAPEKVYNALVKSAHDTLNDMPDGGIVVVNDANEGGWKLSGDDSLRRSAETLQYCGEAIAKARANIETAYARGAATDFDDLIAKVRGLFPRPTESARTTIHDTVESVTDPGAGMANALIDVLNLELEAVLEAAVAAEPTLVRRKPGTAEPETQALDPKAPKVGAPEPPGAKKDLPVHDKRYLVRPGDTLSSIAKARYGDPDAYGPIVRVNHLADPNHIEAGQELILPNVGKKP